jgi:release factor glutamine methyltransferase
MISCKEAHQCAVELLVNAGVPDAEIDAWYLFEHVTGMNRSAYFLHKEEELPKDLKNTEYMI